MPTRLSTAGRYALIMMTAGHLFEAYHHAGFPCVGCLILCFGHALSVAAETWERARFRMANLLETRGLDALLKLIEFLRR